MKTGLQYIYCEEPIKWLFLVAQSNDISSSSVIRVTAIVRIDTVTRYWCAGHRGNSTGNIHKTKYNQFITNQLLLHDKKTKILPIFLQIP